MNSVFTAISNVPSTMLSNIPTIFGIAGFDFIYDMLSSYIPFGGSPVVAYLWNSGRKVGDFFIYNHIGQTLHIS